MVQLSHPYMITGKTIALNVQTFVRKVMSQLFNTLCLSLVKNLPAMQETQVWSLGQEDPWRRHDNSLQYSCLENSMDREAWWATVHGVAKSWTWLSYYHIRFVKPFLSRSKHLFISWLQSPFAVILEPKKIKSVTVPLVPHLFAMKWCHDLSFLNAEF